MIPDYLMGPLYILGGFVLIALTVVRIRRGRPETVFVRYGKLVFAAFAIGMGLLILKNGGH